MFDHDYYSHDQNYHNQIFMIIIIMIINIVRSHASVPNFSPALPATQTTCAVMDKAAGHTEKTTRPQFKAGVLNPNPDTPHCTFQRKRAQSEMDIKPDIAASPPQNKKPIKTAEPEEEHPSIDPDAGGRDWTVEELVMAAEPNDSQETLVLRPCVANPKKPTAMAETKNPAPTTAVLIPNHY